MYYARRRLDLIPFSENLSEKQVVAGFLTIERNTIRTFSVRELFCFFERFYKALILKMLKKFNNLIASIGFNGATGVNDSATAEYIIPSNGFGHFVSKDFNNVAHNVVFEIDNKRSVILIGNVEKVGVVAKDFGF